MTKGGMDDYQCASVSACVGMWACGCGRLGAWECVSGCGGFWVLGVGVGVLRMRTCVPACVHALVRACTRAGGRARVLDARSNSPCGLDW